LLAEHGQIRTDVGQRAARHSKDQTPMSNYPLIADHGLIGNLQTAALVSTDGTIDWFCAPRFDSPSIFGCLLDDDRGGHLRTRPTVDTFTREQLYYPDTAILVTRFSPSPVLAKSSISCQSLVPRSRPTGIS
jgi:GH15 family glucan-1,4-alpha-glucosidase